MTLVAQSQNQQQQEAASSSDAKDVDKQAGRQTYRPNSYSELLNDAVEAVSAAVKNGEIRLEVEFPAVNVDGESGYFLFSLLR